MHVFYLQFNVPDKSRVARVCKKDITEANDWVSSKDKRFGYGFARSTTDVEKHADGEGNVPRKLYSCGSNHLIKFRNHRLIMLLVLYVIC